MNDHNWIMILRYADDMHTKQSMHVKHRCNECGLTRFSDPYETTYRNPAYERYNLDCSDEYRDMWIICQVLST